MSCRARLYCSHCPKSTHLYPVCVQILCSVLAERVIATPVRLLVPLDEGTPLLHELGPVLSCLLQRHQALRHGARVPHYFDNLGWQLGAQRAQQLLRRLYHFSTAALQKKPKHFCREVSGLGAFAGSESGLAPPVEALRWDVGGRDDPRVGIDEPQSNEAAVTWFRWILEAERGDAMLTRGVSIPGRFLQGKNRL
jgi:hypothetical protein